MQAIAFLYCKIDKRSHYMSEYEFVREKEGREKKEIGRKAKKLSGKSELYMCLSFKVHLTINSGTG